MKFLIFLLIYTLQQLDSFAQFSFDDSIICNTKKIDIQNLKNQPYLKLANKVNCDSLAGTSVEERVCANIELQNQDSLLNRELNNTIDYFLASGFTIHIQELLLAQELWERYRYAHCSSCIIDETHYDMILFMRCATDLTIKRRENIKRLYSY